MPDRSPCLQRDLCLSIIEIFVLANCGLYFRTLACGSRLTSRISFILSFVDRRRTRRPIREEAVLVGARGISPAVEPVAAEDGAAPGLASLSASIYHEGPSREGPTRGADSRPRSVRGGAKSHVMIVCWQQPLSSDYWHLWLSVSNPIGSRCCQRLVADQS